MPVKFNRGVYMDWVPVSKWDKYAIRHFESITEFSKCGTMYLVRRKLKGVPQRALQAYCEEHNLEPIELYRQMCDGKKVTFDLLAGGRISKI